MAAVRDAPSAASSSERSSTSWVAALEHGRAGLLLAGPELVEPSSSFAAARTVARWSGPVVTATNLPSRTEVETPRAAMDLVVR